MDHNLLISELQSLIVESKRRNPEVKDASEKALELLRAGPLPKDALAGHSEVLLAPVMLGCKTKVAKIVGISIAALQRLVALGGVPTAALPDILQTLAIAANQAVDVQLKLLQTLLAILTFNKDIHDDILGQALLLCFKLQESRVSVVSSTAAATLRQAVMLIFDRLSAPDEEASLPLSLPTTPPTECTVSPVAMDAFCIFSDLCLLTAGTSGSSLSVGDKEKPRILKLSALQRTFGLELLESILGGYEEPVKQRPELLFLVHHSLTPLLLKLQSEKPTFSVELRICRLLFLLVRSFMEQIPAEVETLLVLLIRLGAGESEAEEGSRKEVITPWTRVLALEVLRGICGDPNLLQKLYEQYDSAEKPSKLFTKLVSSLGRLMHEKPNLLGVSAQMYGHNVPAVTEAPAATNTSGYLDMGLGIMASAASAGVSTVSSMMGSGGGLSNQSGMRQRLIEQHDKAEAPPIPDTYIFLLALGCLNNIAENIFTTVAQTPTPPVAIAGMADSAWPALLAALSFLIGTNLSDSLFSEVLTALQDFTVACGLLGLNTPRDAFISTLGKYAVPPPVVSAMQSYMEAPNPSRSNSVMGAGALGLTALGVGTPSGPPRLSERNLACLKSVVNTARILSSTLGEAWHDVLETLQNANFLLAARRPSKRPTVTSPTLPAPSPTKPRQSSEFPEDRGEMLSDIDAESIQGAINVLFDGTKELSDEAFSTFVTALCRLSSEMIGVEVLAPPEQAVMPSSPRSPSMMLSPTEAGSRRRTSGLSVAGNIRSGDRSFSLSKLRVVATLNLHRLVTADPAVGWDVITHHLLAVSRHITAPSTLRMQATETLGELLLSAVRATQESNTQHKVFDVLVRQVDASPVSSLLSTDYDVRSAGFQTLNQILESSGHSLEVGWQTIFNMLESVCREIAETPSSEQSCFISSRPSAVSSRGNAALVRIAFPSLTLICTDFLSALDPESLRYCITCLGSFGKQREDVNITLAAIGLLWNVSDAVQGIDKDLWLYLLSVLLSLGQDARLEVRSSAMQTLFRCIELYGGSLSSALWEEVLWKVIFPLLGNTTADESQILALTSAGNIFGTFLEPMSKLSSFEKIRDHLLQLLEQSFISGPRQSCTAGLKALERILTTLQVSHNALPNSSDSFLQHSWASFVRMGESISAEGEPHSQEDLIALVRVASLLSRQYDLDPNSLKQLSAILRSAMTYDKSPEYRPDVDVMSPLQTAISDLVSTSSAFDSSTKLSDLADFASLAYLGDSGRVSYVALSKFSMPRISELFDRAGSEEVLYEDGTVESVIAAYALPIKLRYDCPAPSKYGNDPPLWRTSMTTFAPVFYKVVLTLDASTVPTARFEAIWTQILDVLSSILLLDTSNATAETLSDDEEFVLPIIGQMRDCTISRIGDPRIPEALIIKFGETLRKASRLYHHEGSSYTSGTTAPAVDDGMERTRYWAFDLLISLAAKPATLDASDGPSKEEAHRRVADSVTEALMSRFEESLHVFLADARLRGQMPFGRVREEEMLYIFRHLATLLVWPNALKAPQGCSPVLATAYQTSSRSHLFRLWRLLLDISYLNGALPRMWVFPSEYRHLFGSIDPSSDSNYEGEEPLDRISAGDGGDLIEIGIKDLGRRCMELFAEEISGKTAI